MGGALNRWENRAGVSIFLRIAKGTSILRAPLAKFPSGRLRGGPLSTPEASWRHGEAAAGAWSARWGSAHAPEGKASSRDAGQRERAPGCTSRMGKSKAPGLHHSRIAGSDRTRSLPKWRMSRLHAGQGQGHDEKGRGGGEKGRLAPEGEIPPCGAGRRHRAGNHQETRWTSCQAAT